MVANLAFLSQIQQALPGVFQGNFRVEVNTPLWTLTIEMMFYVSVPIIVLSFNRLKRLHVLIFIYLMSIAYYYSFGVLALKADSTIAAVVQKQLPGQLSYFISGAILYYYFDVFKRYKSILLAFAACVLFFDSMPGRAIIEPFAMGIVVIYAAYFLPYMGNCCRYGDISYGIYIVHMPIIQIFISLGVYRSNPYLGMVLSVCVIVSAAYILWYLVERHFLSRDSHYVKSQCKGLDPIEVCA